MDFLVQIFFFVVVPLIIYWLIAILFKQFSGKHLYICPLHEDENIYRSLLPQDYQRKREERFDEDGGYIYSSDPDEVFEQLQTLVKTLHCQGALKSLDPYNLIDLHERLAFTNSHDLVNWFTVQFNLFAGSLAALGTEIHRELIEDARLLKKLGCFALTEKNAGVLSGLFCETIAFYDQQTKKILINTPNENAKKCWISYAGNDHVEYAVVFAKWAQNNLSTNEKKSIRIETTIGQLFLTSHVVAIVVQIRNDGILLPNIQIDRCYTRSDFRSNDFGFLTFNNFQTSTDNLLNRFCSLDLSNGHLKVPENCPKLFLKLSNRLLVGRLCLSSTAIVCAKTSLNLLINKVYQSERKKYSYLTDQIHLMIKQISQMDFYFRRLIKRFQIDQSTNVDIEHLLETNLEEILLVKAFIPPLCRTIVGKCRELIGAEALLAHHRINESHAGSYANCLAEGDSTIMALAFVGQVIRKKQKKYLSIRNWRLLLLIIQFLFLIPKHQQIDFINSHQTQILAAFQQIAEGIFENPSIYSNLQSIPIPHF